MMLAENIKQKASNKIVLIFIGKIRKWLGVLFENSEAAILFRQELAEEAGCILATGHYYS